MTNSLKLINEKKQQVLIIENNKIVEITIQASKCKLVKDKKKKLIPQTKSTRSKMNAKKKWLKIQRKKKIVKKTIKRRKSGGHVSGLGGTLYTVSSQSGNIFLLNRYYN